MIVPPPPIESVAPASNLVVVVATPGPIACDGTMIRPLALERPFPTSLGTWRGMPAPTPQRFHFRVGANGRPAGIARDANGSSFFGTEDDMAAALAASRFAPGASHAACTISYAVALVPFGRAGPALLAELVSAPEPGVGTREAYDLLAGGGSCRIGPGGPRRITYPSFERIPQPPGTRGWSFLRFDVDARGRARDVEVAYSSGNAALDRAGAAALRADRYAPRHPVAGCSFHFFREGERPLPAPDVPADAPADSGDPACDLDPTSISTLFNGDAYPRAFGQRRLEGYAIIGFDTASWGAVGNARVLASEPAEAFGQATLQAVSNGHVAPGDQGRRGCVQRVRFRLPAGQ